MDWMAKRFLRQWAEGSIVSPVVAHLKHGDGAYYEVEAMWLGQDGSQVASSKRVSRDSMELLERSGYIRLKSRVGDPDIFDVEITPEGIAQGEAP